MASAEFTYEDDPVVVRITTEHPLPEQALASMKRILDAVLPPLVGEHPQRTRVKVE